MSKLFTKYITPLIVKYNELVHDISNFIFCSLTFNFEVSLAGEVVALPHHAGVPTSVVYLRLLNSHTKKSFYPLSKF